MRSTSKIQKQIVFLMCMCCVLPAWVPLGHPAPAPCLAGRAVRVALAAAHLRKHSFQSAAGDSTDVMFLDKMGIDSSLRTPPNHENNTFSQGKHQNRPNWTAVPRKKILKTNQFRRVWHVLSMRPVYQRNGHVYLKSKYINIDNCIQYMGHPL